jgi:glycosidase
MLWGDGDLIKDPIGTTYPASKQITTTVADQIEDNGSMYNYYCKLIAIRHKHPAIARGDYSQLTTSNKNLGGFLVEYNGEKLGILHNTSTEEISYDLSKCASLMGYTFTEICDFIGSGSARLEGTTIVIGPQTSVILK